MPFSFPMALSSPAPYLLSESSWSADDVKKILLSGHVGIVEMLLLLADQTAYSAVADSRATISLILYIVLTSLSLKSVRKMHVFQHSKIDRH